VGRQVVHIHLLPLFEPALAIETSKISLYRSPQMTLHRACDKYEVPVGSMKQVSVAGQDLLVANVDGSFYALHSWCTHEEGNLSEGVLRKNVVTCPKHGAQFDVTTGKALLGPDGESADSIQPEKSYKVLIQGNDVMVEIV
jgi:3-phenylpropionate/trans-cinnamate dioxygenase ferredoxin subunit